MSQLADQQELANIRRAILPYLARRDYSQQELVLKLKAKAYSETAIHAVIIELVKQGLINEQRFTENYIYWRRGKGFGPLRIAAELQAKGIPSEMIAEQIQITDNAWLMQVRKVWQKHFKGNIPENFKLKAKQLRFLQYRGFTREQIEHVLENTI